MNGSAAGTSGDTAQNAFITRFFGLSETCSNTLHAGIGPKLQLLAFFLSAAIVISHRPDAITNPQFFGEDGTIWYPEAYMSGWFAALFHSRNGYFQTVPRLAASAALLFPLRFAPLVENLIGLFIQVLPVNILLSARCQRWAPLFTRILMSVLYLGLPNTRELDVAAEEAQWHLALVACMVVLACPPVSWRWRTFDLVIVIVSGLSGPFAIFLFPITLVLWWFRRQRWLLPLAAVNAVAAGIQLSALIPLAEATRSHAGLGATPSLFVRLMGGQVILSAILGRSGQQVQRPLPILVLALAFGFIVAAYCVWKGRLEWKLLLIFCALVIAASLKNPMVSMRQPQWQVLENASGIRYWFFPMLGFVWAMAWCATLGGNGVFRFAGVAGLIMTATGMIADWHYLPYTDYHYAQSAAKFEAAAPGEMVNIPIDPNGWMMRLAKNSPACHGLLLGSVDQPQPGAQISSSAAISGWVAANEPVRSVEIYVDRRLVQKITPEVRRPDVDSFYPQSPDRFKGWAASLDLSQLPAGPHEIELRASEPNGCEKDFAIIPVDRPK